MTGTENEVEWVVLMVGKARLKKKEKNCLHFARKGSHHKLAVTRLVSKGQIFKQIVRAQPSPQKSPYKNRDKRALHTARHTPHFAFSVSRNTQGPLLLFCPV